MFLYINLLAQAFDAQIPIASDVGEKALISRDEICSWSPEFMYCSSIIKTKLMSFASQKSTISESSTKSIKPWYPLIVEKTIFSLFFVKKLTYYHYKTKKEEIFYEKNN